MVEGIADLFINIWCMECGCPTAISGSTPMSKAACVRCGSKNFEFERMMSSHTLEQYKLSYSNKSKGKR